MSTFEYPADRAMAFWAAVYRSDSEAMRRFFNEDPDIFGKVRKRNYWIVGEAAKHSSPQAVRALIELGAKIDEQDSNGFTGLCWAVTKGRLDVAELLLECGADPNLDCPIFNVACQELEDPIAMAQLLLDHGADINQPFLVEDLPPRTVLSEAMARGRGDLVEFLKSRGAQLPGALPASKKTETASVVSAAGDYTPDILAHFRRYFGKPDEKVIREIVPSSANPIAVHHTRASWTQGSTMLFTVGLSRFALPVPKGAEQYRLAELMVALPKSWPAADEAVKDARWAWPIQWLRKIAAYPVENNTWLGGPWTVLSNEEPPQPLGPGTRFSAWVMTSPDTKEHTVKCSDGSTIQLYRLFPLYTEEYLLEREHGVNALMSQFKKHGMPEYIDLNRPNVALSE